MCADILFIPSLGNVRISVDCFIPIRNVPSFADKIEGFSRNEIPIAEDPSGNIFYLSSSNLRVYLWEHEEGSLGRLIANSFSEFLSALEPFDADSIQLKPGQVESVWVDPNFKPEF